MRQGQSRLARRRARDLATAVRVARQSEMFVRKRTVLTDVQKIV
jgi:hypothetical protein